MAAPDDDEALLAFKALANPTRLAIMEWLRDPVANFPPQDHSPEEFGVCLKHIQAKAGVSQSTASQFMSTLQRAGLVTSRRMGQWTHYKRDDERLERLADLFRRSP